MDQMFVLIEHTRGSLVATLLVSEHGGDVIDIDLLLGTIQKFQLGLHPTHPTHLQAHTQISGLKQFCGFETRRAVKKQRQESGLGFGGYECARPEARADEMQKLEMDELSGCLSSAIMHQMFKFTD